MIHDLIIFVLVTVFWCCGLFAITENGKIFYFLRKPFEKTRAVRGVTEKDAKILADNGIKEYVIPAWISNPLLMCITCLASVHGILMFMILLSYDVIEFNLVVLVLGCIMASFIQTFIWSAFDWLRVSAFYFQQKTNHVE